MQTESRTALAFGKLPDRGDFVRYNVKGPAVGAMDNWVQKGLQVASSASSFEAAYASAPPFHFWFDAGASSGILAGTIHPSRDRIGREYPFLVAGEADQARYDSSQLPRIPARWTNYFDNAGQLAMAVVDGRLSFDRMTPRLKLLNTAVNDETAPDEAYHQFLQETTLEQFCKRLWHEFDDPRKYVLFKNLIAVVFPLRAGIPARFPLALRFPLGEDLRTRSFEVGFWLETCLRLLDTAEVRPSFFWTAPQSNGKDAPFLLFALRPPTARYFAYLFAGLSDDQLCDLDQMGLENAADAAGSLPGDLGGRLESRTLRLGQLLEKLSSLADSA